MVSKIEPDRYADTGFSIADTPPELNAHLFREMMRKTGAERLIIGCQMADTARALVWSGIPRDLPEAGRRSLFLHRFYGPTVAATTGRRSTVAGASRSRPSPEHLAPGQATVAAITGRRFPRGSNRIRQTPSTTQAFTDHHPPSTYTPPLFH